MATKILLTFLLVSCDVPTPPTTYELGEVVYVSSIKMNGKLIDFFKIEYNEGRYVKVQVGQNFIYIY